MGFGGPWPPGPPSGSATARNLKLITIAEGPPTMPNGISIRRRGRSVRITQFATVRFLCIFGLFVTHTGGLILTIYTPYNVFSCLLCAFWRFCWYTSTGVKSPKTVFLGGVNRHFQTKRMKYSNFHIIETTTWIPAKFLHTSKDH